MNHPGRPMDSMGYGPFRPPFRLPSTNSFRNLDRHPWKRTPGALWNQRYTECAVPGPNDRQGIEAGSLSFRSSPAGSRDRMTVKALKHLEPLGIRGRAERSRDRMTVKALKLAFLADMSLSCRA